MHLITIMGGLGNQLFQYAFARYVQFQTSRRVGICWNGPSVLEREVEFDKIFITKLPFLSPEQHFHFLKFGSTNQFYVFFLRAGRKFGFLKEGSQLYNRLVTDVHLVTDNMIQPAEKQLLRKKNVHYHGYWQSTAMVNQVGHLLLKDLKATVLLSQTSQEILTKINNTHNSTALHIRGTWINGWDMAYSRKAVYTNHPQRSLQIDYYIKAIAQIEKRRGLTTFFVFSDDVNVATELLDNLSTRSPLIFVKHKRQADWEDLYLMQHCQNFILSNSSFCWWACWLAYATRPQEDRLSIMPQNWTGHHEKRAEGKRYSDRLKIAADTIQL